MPLQPANARFRSAVRVGGVVVGTAAGVPLIAVSTIIIRASDEFVRRIHLVALALAFVSALMLLSLLGWLVDARFMRAPDLKVLWLAFAVLWAIWLFVVKIHFERRGA
jgi:hypothetical protein